MQEVTGIGSLMRFVDEVEHCIINGDPKQQPIGLVSSLDNKAKEDRQWIGGIDLSNGPDMTVYRTLK